MPGRPDRGLDGRGPGRRLFGVIMLYRITVLVLCAALLATGVTLGLPGGTWADGSTSGPGQDPPPRPPRLPAGGNMLGSPMTILYLQCCLMTL